MVIPGAGMRAAMEDTMRMYPLPRCFMASPNRMLRRVTVPTCKFSMA